MDQSTGEQAPESSVEVELRPSSAPAFAAIVRLVGEHDLATRDLVNDALLPIHGAVLVDLTDCSFVDSTIIACILRKCAEAATEGFGLELVVLRASQVARTLELAGAHQLLVVHDRALEVG